MKKILFLFTCLIAVNNESKDVGLIAGATTAGILTLGLFIYKLKDPVLRNQISELFKLSNWQDVTSKFPKNVQTELNQLANEHVAKLNKVYDNFTRSKKIGLETSSVRNKTYRLARENILQETAIKENYIKAKSNISLAQTNEGKMIINEVTPQELSKAIKDYAKIGGKQNEIVNDLKNNIKNFVDKDGNAKISLEEWKDILKDAGFKDFTVNDFAKNLEQIDFYKTQSLATQDFKGPESLGLDEILGTQTVQQIQIENIPSYIDDDPILGRSDTTKLAEQKFDSGRTIPESEIMELATTFK